MLIGNEKLNIDIVRAELQPLFKRHKVKRAILFGSVAKNSNSIDSDVDILVDSGLKGLKFLGLVEDIHNTLNKSVDVLDIAYITKNSKVDREIKKDGVLIYDEGTNMGYIRRYPKI